MATPRKHWFRVADSVAFEPWSNDVMATFTRLLAHLNTRWAREGRAGMDAGSVVLSRAVAQQLTGSGSLARARSILHELAANVSLTVSEHGTNTLVEWPNSAIFQKWAPESGARVESDAPPVLPPPQDAPARRKTQDAKKNKSPLASLAATPPAVAADPPPDPEPEPAARRTKEPPSPEAVRLAELLRDEILRVDPERKLGTGAAWTREIERMLGKDARDARDLERLIRWHYEHVDRPYALVIWSAKALREKFDRLRDQHARGATNATNPPATTASGLVVDIHGIQRRAPPMGKLEYAAQRLAERVRLRSEARARDRADGFEDARVVSTDGLD